MKDGPAATRRDVYDERTGWGMMAVMRVRYEKLGKHYHCRVFTAPEWHLTFANCGELVFDEIEWESVKAIMGKAEFIDSQPNRKGA